MKLKINKPKTRPIQIEPWFFRYLNEGEIKVVAAILSHADIKNRQENSFPSNRVIAFYCGFGLIEEDSKAYEKYKKLNDEEKKGFKNKRVKNAIQTVKNIKKSLEKKGLLRREYTGQKGKQIVYMTLDLEWKKETYLKDYDEFFNDIEPKIKEEKEEISKELEELQRLNNEGNISKDNLANRLKDLSYKIEAIDKEKSEVPIEDIEKVANYYMNTSKIQNKIEKGEIENKEAYKKSIIKSITNNSFNDVKKYYQGLIKKEKEDILNTLRDSIQYNENETFYQKHILYFEDIKFEDNIFLLTYESKDKNIRKHFILSDEKLKYYIHTSNFYSKPNKKIIDKYLENIINYQNKLKQPQDIKNKGDTS